MGQAIGLGLGVPFGAGAGSYLQKLLSVQPAKLIAYWPLNETRGTTADNAEGTAARDGDYTGVTLADAEGPDGQPVPLFDGTNDYCDIYSDSFRDAFDGSEGTLALFAKVENAGVLSDGTNRRAMNLLVDANNSIFCGRQSGANQINFVYEAGGVSEVNVITPGDTDWMHLAITWSAQADEVKFYYKGAQSGTTATGLGTWAGDLISSATLLGAATTVPGFVWQGWLAHAAVWTTPLTATEIAALATV